MDELIKDIRTGNLQAGQKLPSEKELASRFQVNVNTVRRAISQLQKTGLVRGERGSGTYVKEDTIRYPVTPRQQRNNVLRRLQRANLRQVLGAKTMRASSEVAAGLQIEPGSYVKKVETLNWADSRPSSFSTYYYPLPRFLGIEDRIKTYGSITRALDDFGVHDYRRLQSIVRPKTLTAREAGLLQQARTKPSLMVVNINVEANGTPIQMSVNVEASWIELIIRFDEDTSSMTPASPLKFDVDD